MPEKKKSQSVEDIINEYKQFHHATGKKFEERIKKFEEFHDPNNIHAKQLAHHAHYVVFGKPGHEEEFPGAFPAAYKVLDKHYADDDATVDEDKLTEILETLADTFLEKERGGGYQKLLDQHQKEIEKIFSNEKDPQKAAEKKKQSLREFKGILLGRYHPDDEGHSGNVFSDTYLKSLKGKKKVDFIDELRGLSEKIRQTYTARLHGKALEGLISEEDLLPMAEYITPIFEERGWKHKKPHVMRSAIEQSSHYQALLLGAGDKLKEAGYKPIKYEKKEKKK